MEYLYCTYSQRKNAENMKAQLETIVAPVFCTALIGAGENKQAKLNKVRTEHTSISMVMKNYS